MPSKPKSRKEIILDRAEHHFAEHGFQGGSLSAIARECDVEAYGQWCRELLSRGVYPPASQFEAWFPSLAHTPEHVERTLEAAAAAFSNLPEPAAEG